MRRLIIDRLISEKGCVTFQELQDVLKASSPTIKRDIRYMREQLGAPITYSRADGGYRYSTFESSKTDAPVRTFARRAGSKVGNAPLDFLRKLWYSSTELLVLKTTVDLLELLACDKTSAIFSELEPLRSRVVSLFSLGDTLPRELLRRVKVVRNNKFFVESRAFETIGCALSSRHRAKIRYYTPSRDEETDREISPLRLVHYRNRWYVDAYCHRAEELRTFRIENIRRAELLPTAARRMGLEAVETALDSGYGIFHGKEMRWAEIRMTKADADIVLRESWAERQEVSVVEGEVVLRVPYADSRELVGEILRWGSRVRVTQPLELRRAVQEAAQAVLSQYTEN